MTTIVGIRFKDSGKIYYFAPGHLDLEPGEVVIVETTRGPEMAKIAYGQRDVDDDEIVGELKPVMRRAEQADFDRLQMLNARHDEIMQRCSEKIRDHGLPMDLIKTEYSFDGSRLTFYFTAEQRVDFRMLVRDLARTFRSRIELRQIGPRDEAKLLGGIGPCGRLLCCATFLPDYARVSIKMAKDQDLPLNPSKISGLCGRLLCCLSYEHQQYLDMKAMLPSKNDWVQTPDGPGNVVVVNVLQQSVTVRLASSGMEADYSIAQLQQATSDVHEVARQRNQQGITPYADRASGTAYAYNEDEESDDTDLLRMLDSDVDEEPASRSGKPAASRQQAEGTRSEDATGDAPRKARRSRRRKRKPTTQQAPGEQPESTASVSDSSNKPTGETGEDDSKTAKKRSLPRRRKRKPAQKTESGDSE